MLPGQFLLELMIVVLIACVLVPVLIELIAILFCRHFPWRLSGIIDYITAFGAVSISILLITALVCVFIK